MLAVLQNGFNLIGYSANTIYLILILILGLAILASMIAARWASTRSIRTWRWSTSCPFITTCSSTESSYAGRC
nr:hypothetical protein [Actinoplanes solisilvae]